MRQPVTNCSNSAIRARGSRTSRTEPGLLVLLGDHLALSVGGGDDVGPRVGDFEADQSHVGDKTFG